MEAKVWYWTGAWLNMAVIVSLVAFGIREARARRFARHRRAMLGAAFLVLAFILSYVLKLSLLGREQLELWSPASVRVLQFHEACVTLMIVGGGIALWRAARLRRSRLFSGRSEDPAPGPGLARSHRRAGWVAVLGAVFGLLSSLVVLAGMMERSGSFDAPLLDERLPAAAGSPTAPAR